MIDETLRGLLLSLHKGEGDALLTTTRIIRHLALHILGVVHEARDIPVEQRNHQQILRGHLVLMIVYEQLSADLIELALAEQEIILQAILSQCAVKRMLVDGFLIAQHLDSALRPGTVEDGLLQQAQILLCHLVLAIDQVGLCKTLHHARTLIVIRYGLHRLESKALGRVDQSEVEVDLTTQLCRSEITLELRQQALCAMLVEVEGALAKLIRHAQGKIGGTDAHRQVGHLFLCLGDDAVPITNAHQIVVFDEFVLLLLKAQVDQTAHQQQHHDSLSHFDLLACLRKQADKIPNDKYHHRNSHQHVGQRDWDPIVADAEHDPHHREGEPLRAEQHQRKDIDDSQRHQEQGWQKSQRPDKPVKQRHQDKDHLQLPQGRRHIIAPRTEKTAKAPHGSQRHRQGYDIGQHDVLVAHGIPQHRDWDKTQGIMTR